MRNQPHDQLRRLPSSRDTQVHLTTNPADARELKRRHEYERMYPKFFRRMDLTSGWAYRASGKLSIIPSKAQYVTGIPSQWHDLASHPVETRLREVLAAAVEHAEVLKDRQRRVDERMAELRADDERRSRKEAERDQLQQRTAFLVDRVHAFDLVSRIERYMKPSAQMTIGTQRQ